jgi:hypothetical protein
MCYIFSCISLLPRGKRWTFHFPPIPLSAGNRGIQKPLLEQGRGERIKEGRKEGKKEEREERIKEGRKERKKGGREEGR